MHLFLHKPNKGCLFQVFLYNSFVQFFKYSLEMPQDSSVKGTKGTFFERIFIVNSKGLQSICVKKKKSQIRK